MALDLFTLIFTEILKVSPTLIAKYSTIQDQIINLIFLPHVILFLFIWGFGMMMMPPEKTRANAHRGFRYLLSLTAYVVIIYQGWYGSFLIPLLQTWFYLMLGAGLVLFFVSKIYHPVTAKEFGKFGDALGKSVGTRLAKDKQIEVIEEELGFIRKRMRDLEPRRNNNDSAAIYEYESYSKQEQQLKRELKKLED